MESRRALLVEKFEGNGRRIVSQMFFARGCRFVSGYVTNERLMVAMPEMGFVRSEEKQSQYKPRFDLNFRLAARDFNEEGD